MSGCRTHADLIGPYVLEALEPDEMQAMRRHLEGCARCAAEVHSLAGAVSYTHLTLPTNREV